MDEIVKVKAEQDSVNLTAIQAQIDMEYKDKYIDRLVFLLIPYLDLLSANIMAKIQAMPVDIGMMVTPTDRRAPKPVIDVETRLANAGMGKQGDASIVDT